MSKELRIVVVGHSLRDDSRPVVRSGLTIARAWQGRLELVHAFTPLRHRLRLGQTTRDLLSWEQLQERLSEELEEEAAALGIAKDSAVGWHLESAPPHEALNEVAAALDGDLIVVGPAESGSLRRGVLGSTVHRLLHTANRPVLVVREEIEQPPRRVVAAVDFSTHSIEAWHAARLLFEDMPGAASEVEILTVLDRDETQRPLSSEQLDDFVREELRRLVEDHLGLERPAPDFEVRRGEPRDVIVTEVRERRADLLVVGAHGRAGTERSSLIGRVAHDMAQRAPCNVLVVPAGAVWIAAADDPARSRSDRRNEA